jgi:hypothetical protein
LRGFIGSDNLSLHSKKHMTFYQVSIFQNGSINSWIENDDGKLIFDMGLTANFPPQYGNTPEQMTNHLREIGLISDADRIEYRVGEYKRKL